MRKHFLILMLMALLPLAGWAADGLKVGSNVVYAIDAISNGELVYNKSDFKETAWTIKYQTAQNGEWLTLDPTQYTVQYYKLKTDATEVENAINAGDYYIGITGKSVTDGTGVYGVLPTDKRFKFTVKQRPLSITVQDATKVYGADTPTWLWNPVDASQFATGDNKTNVGLTFNMVLKEGDTDLNAGGEHTFQSVTATDIKGNYKVTVTNATTLKFTVEQRELHVAIGTNAANFTKNYYVQDADALTLNITGGLITVSGYATGDNFDLVYPSNNKISYTYALKGNRQADANVDKVGAFLSANMADYADYKIDFSNSGIALPEAQKKNYKIVYDDRYMCIKPIQIVAAGENSPFFYTAGTTNFTYTGSEQEPTNHKIEYKYGNGSNDKITLNKGVDYDFAYKLSNIEATPIDATGDGKYAVSVITASGTTAKKNFYVDGEGLAVTAFDYAIKKKALSILVNPQSKTYNGNVQTFTATFTYDGLVDADKNLTIVGMETSPVPAEGDDTQSATPTYVNDVKAAAAKYYRMAKYDAAKFQWPAPTQQNANAVGEKLITVNYAINALKTGYFEVAPKALKVEVKKNKSIVYTTALPTTMTLAAYQEANELSDADFLKDINVEGAVSNAELTSIKAALNIGLKQQYTTDDDDNEVAVANADYYNTVKNYPGCWVVTPVADNVDANNDQTPDNAVLKNYKITYTAKDFEIKVSGFTMLAVNVDKEYDAKAATADDLQYMAYVGETTVEIPENVEVAYEWLDGETWKDTDFPKGVGQFTYRVKANAAYAPANYNGNEIQYPTATLTITPKTIKIKVKDVKLHAGDNEAILNKYATVAKQNNQPWIVDGDELALVYSFTTHVTGVTNIWDATNKKLKYSSIADENTITGAVTVRLATKADFAANGIFEGQDENLLQNGNYKLSTEAGAIVAGKLTILPGEFITFDVAEGDDYVNSMEAVTEAAAAATTPAAKKKNVRFTNTLYTLPAGKWSTLVLPFDITPLEFCNMTGISQYAIFNKLTSANASTNVVRFSLEQENLPANTPFLVKAPKAIDLDKVEFTDRIMNYEETPTATVSQAKFIGSYVDVENIEGGANKMWWSKSAGNFVKATNNGEAAAFPNYCFHAYLVLDSSFSADANVRILVEEADGTVTAISNIDAEGVAVPAEGWYTINGVKLQGAPTQKGIYINNGKKIVVK